MVTLREQARNAWRTLFTHHVNQLSAIDRAATAKAWGLDAEKYASPFVQHIPTNVNMFQDVADPPKPPKSVFSRLLPLVAGTALLGTGVGGGLLLAHALLKPSVEKITEKITTTPGIKRDANVKAEAVLDDDAPQ